MAIYTKIRTLWSIDTWFCKFQFPVFMHGLIAPLCSIGYLVIRDIVGDRNHGNYTLKQMDQLNITVADCASRGLSPRELSEHKKGPQLLTRDSSFWPTRLERISQEVTKELKITLALLAEINSPFDKYSSHWSE